MIAVELCEALQKTYLSQIQCFLSNTINWICVDQQSLQGTYPPLLSNLQNSQHHGSWEFGRFDNIGGFIPCKLTLYVKYHFNNTPKRPHYPNKHPG